MDDHYYGIRADKNKLTKKELKEIEKAVEKIDDGSMLDKRSMKKAMIREKIKEKKHGLRTDKKLYDEEYK